MQPGPARPSLCPPDRHSWKGDCGQHSSSDGSGREIKTEEGARGSQWQSTHPLRCWEHISQGTQLPGDTSSWQEEGTPGDGSLHQPAWTPHVLWLFWSFCRVAVHPQRPSTRCLCAPLGAASSARAQVPPQQGLVTGLSSPRGWPHPGNQTIGSLIHQAGGR